MSNIRIALLGDYSAAVKAHIAMPPALELAAKAMNVQVEPVWIHPSKLASKEEVLALLGYHGIWCLPASPYANTEGAISAISLARTRGLPFLGTCAGFQHVLIEYFSDGPINACATGLMRLCKGLLPIERSSATNTTSHASPSATDHRLPEASFFMARMALCYAGLSSGHIGILSSGYCL
jgi:hypothetical protein